ncbi:MAG: efflux RND transporter periplasmic adaptor subunit, partial [Verrucomicrobiota bacterium]
LIEEGKLVRERQAIIRLPDPLRMQVMTGINESQIELVEAGQTASIRVDALPDEVLYGTLDKLSEFPMPRTSSYTAHIKDYGAVVTIKDPPSNLRPGMTAEVSILIDERHDALQVPIQAVVERKDRFFCLVQGEGEEILSPREVEIGGANEKFVLIEAGLKEAEEVVLGPDSYIDDFALPHPSELVLWKQANPGLYASAIPSLDRARL